MTIVAPSTGARVRRNALTAIEAGVPADSFAHLSIALITLFALAPVAAWRVLADGILAAQMLIR